MKKVQTDVLLRKLDKKIKQLRKAVTTHSISSVEIKSLKKEILSTKKALKGKLSTPKFAHKLGALAILFGLSFSAQAQTYDSSIELHQDDNFIPIQAIDIDGDGDLDLFGLDYNNYGTFGYLENTAGPNVAPEYDLTINQVLTDEEATVSGLGDFDDDGDLDFIGLSYDAEENPALTYYENQSGDSSFDFATPVINPFGATLPEGAFHLGIADFDNDGDIDVLISEYYGTVYALENVGSAQAPSLAPAVSLLSLGQGSAALFPQMADFDRDGDQDLVFLDYYDQAVLKYAENEGTDQSPEFLTTTDWPFGVPTDSDIALIIPGDYDEDGDVDFIFYDYVEGGGSTSYYYENSDIAQAVTELETEISLYPNPTAKNLQWNTEAEISSIRILSISGAELLSTQVQSNSVNVDFLQSGNYIIEFRNQEGHTTSRTFQKL